MGKMCMIGVYWGRFNPPHKGHMRMIRRFLKEVEMLVIAIGRSESMNEKRNPFNGKERARMMRAYLREEGIDKVKIVLVPDGKSYYEAIRNLFAFCPRFDVMYTDKETIIRAVERKVKVKRFQRIEKVSATMIRNAIAHDMEWKHLTGKSVARIIKELGGIERIKRMY